MSNFSRNLLVHFLSTLTAVCLFAISLIYQTTSVHGIIKFGYILNTTACDICDELTTYSGRNVFCCLAMSKCCGFRTMNSEEKNPRILSIQSHVVSGYCGNKSAVFPLQLLGFEVDFINTVQLSNHTQYKTTRGHKSTREEIDELAIGLRENCLLDSYDQVLTGYVTGIGYIQSMSKLIQEIKEIRKSKGLSCLYTFDPVLGDDGPGFYVPDGPKVAEAYQKYLLPLADIITPNRFEASQLTGKQINDQGSSNELIKESLEAIEELHKFGVKVVALTSLQPIDKKDELLCILSYAANADQLRNSANCSIVKSDVWIISLPKLDCPFTGTGDLFAALISAWLNKTNFDLKRSLEHTANSIQLILEDTFKRYKIAGDQSVRSHELRLIQNQVHLSSPKIVYRANCLEKN